MLGWGELTKTLNREELGVGSSLFSRAGFWNDERKEWGMGNGYGNMVMGSLGMWVLLRKIQGERGGIGYETFINALRQRRG